MAVKRTPTTARTSAKQISLAERRAIVLKLRKEGLAFRAIAARIGGVSAATCYRDVVESIAAITREPANELLTLELLRLDRLQHAIFAKATAGKLAAINATLAIMDRRARLLGLYDTASPGSTAPDKSAVRVLLPDGEL